jgi:hypothetical protein
MTRAKVWPMVKLAHYMVCRHGTICGCVTTPLEPEAICRSCYGTGWVGGYVLHNESVSYYRCGQSVTDDLLVVRTYQMVEPGDLTRYALGDVLVDLTSTERWSVCGFNVGKVYARLVHPYEAAEVFPVVSGAR